MRITVLTPSIRYVLRRFASNVDVFVLFKHNFPIEFLYPIALMCKTGQVITITMCDLGFTLTKLANQTDTIFIMNGCVTKNIQTVCDICIFKSHAYLNSRKT